MYFLSENVCENSLSCTLLERNCTFLLTAFHRLQPHLSPQIHEIHPKIALFAPKTHTESVKYLHIPTRSDRPSPARKEKKAVPLHPQVAIFEDEEATRLVALSRHRTSFFFELPFFCASLGLVCIVWCSVCASRHMRYRVRNCGCRIVCRIAPPGYPEAATRLVAASLSAAGAG